MTIYCILHFFPFVLIQGVTGYLILKPSYMSHWQTIKAQSWNFSSVTFHHELNELPIKVLAEIKIRIEGKDYIFNTQGSAQIDDDNEGLFGGVICLYNKTHVELFAPLGITNTRGGIVYTGGTGWIGPLPANVSLFTEGQVRVKVWRRWDFPKTGYFHNWTFVHINGSKHVYDFHHKLGEFPDYVIVQVRGRWQKYTMEAQGSMSILEQYKTDTVVGGVMFGYSTDTVRVWIPKPYENSTISTVNLMFNADGWTRSQNWIFETRGDIRIYVWKFKNESSIEIQNKANDLDFTQPIALPKSLALDQSLLLVEVEILDGPNMGYRYQAVGTTFNDGWYGAFGGLLYARDEDKIFLWKPEIFSNGYLFHLFKDGLFGSNMTYQHTNNAMIRVAAWDTFTIGDIRCKIDIFESYEKKTNSIVNITGVGFGDKLVAQCRYGYRYIGGQNYGECRRSGEWSQIRKANRILCEVIVCPELPEIENGQIISNGNFLDDVTTYECDEGFQMVNSTTGGIRKCLADSTWDSSQPSCVRIDTGCPLDNLYVQFATYDTTGANVGDKALYTCLAGYPYVTGSLTRICQSNGTWSGSKPVCKSCECMCRPNQTTTNETLDEIIDEIRKDLKIEATNTSKARRMKISIRDDRPSARGIGAIGVALLVIIFVAVLVPDIPRVIMDIKRGLSNICCKGT